LLLHPGFENISDKCVILVEVRIVVKTAHFQVARVIEVGYLALSVIVSTLIKWNNFAEVKVNFRHVVGLDI